jgi:hypothetical protein
MANSLCFHFSAMQRRAGRPTGANQSRAFELSWHPRGGSRSQSYKVQLFLEENKKVDPTHIYVNSFSLPIYSLMNSYLLTSRLVLEQVAHILLKAHCV